VALVVIGAFGAMDELERVALSLRYGTCGGVRSHGCTRNERLWANSPARHVGETFRGFAAERGILRPADVVDLAWNATSAGWLTTSSIKYGGAFSSFVCGKAVAATT
jgi:hypothetical protein